MTREQAQKEYEQLLNRTVAEKRRIEEEAKRNGTWKAGLDSNNHLFAKIDSEFANKVKKIQSKVEACMPLTIPKHEVHESCKADGGDLDRKINCS